MAKRSKIAQQAFEIAEPIVAEMGIELVDAEYKKEGKDMFLRLIIDKVGGVSSDDCEAVSRTIDPILDEKLKSDADYFEVSSPGLTRPLETEADFRRYKDELIEVSLFAEMDGYKSFLAEIKAVDEDKVVFGVLMNRSTNKSQVKYSEVAELKIAYDKIAKAVRHIEF